MKKGEVESGLTIEGVDIPDADIFKAKLSRSTNVGND